MEDVENKTELAVETEETKVDEVKASEEKVATEADAKAETLGADFDKKADEGDDHTAYTDDDKAKEAQAKTEAEVKTKEAQAKADEEAGKKDSEQEVDESLLERAVRAGLSLEKAKEYGSLLELTVQLLEESQSKTGKAPEEIETETKAKEEAEAKAKEDEADYDCKLDPAEYDEGLIKAFNELGTMLKKRVVSLESGHTKNTDSLRSNRVTAHTDWLDSKVNHLTDDDLVKVYGKGECDDLEAESPEYKARAALDTQISKMAADLRKANKTVPSRNRLFNLAIEALHKGKSTKKADAKTKAKLEARAKESLGGGSNRVSAESAEEQALQTNKDFDSKIDDD